MANNFDTRNPVSYAPLCLIILGFKSGLPRVLCLDVTGVQVLHVHGHVVSTKTCCKHEGLNVYRCCGYEFSQLFAMLSHVLCWVIGWLVFGGKVGLDW